MDSNSVKQIKKWFTEMFNDHYKKVCEMYNGLVQIKNLKSYWLKNDQILTVWTYFCRKPDLEESLTVNQDLIDVKIKSIDKEMKEIKKIVDNNRAELKEQLRIQDDYSQRNKVRFDGIPETEKKT